MKISITRIAAGTIAVLIIFLLVAVLAITVDGISDNLVNADWAIVPGNTVNLDGTPSKRLQSRLDAALDLYRTGRCKLILVSGGVGAEGFDEAEVMKKYLVLNGVPSDRIITDNHGVNTYETARFAAELKRSKNLGDPLLVTQFFHVSRFRLALEKHGVHAAGNVHARYFEERDVYSTLREVVGYVGYWFKAGEVEPL